MYVIACIMLGFFVAIFLSTYLFNPLVRLCVNRGLYHLLNVSLGAVMEMSQGIFRLKEMKNVSLLSVAYSLVGYYFHKIQCIIACAVRSVCATQSKGVYKPFYHIA